MEIEALMKTVATILAAVLAARIIALLLEHEMRLHDLENSSRIVFVHGPSSDIDTKEEKPC